MVTFTPVEPYFFGNEKTFLYPKSENASQLANQYFIRSETVPSQTTILGALRYLLLPVKRSDYAYTENERVQNAVAVGSSSFDAALPGRQDFGRIRHISPLFLFHKDEGAALPLPMDHNTTRESEYYAPFSDYNEMNTLDGAGQYAPAFDPKQGATSGFLYLKDGRLLREDTVFQPVVRTGIRRGVQEKGFFKKEYCMLSEGYSFAVYLELDGILSDSGLEESKPFMVFLGQGKSAFYVRFTKGENRLAEMMRPYLREGVVYCQGDAFLPSDIYAHAKFSYAAVKTYRGYQTRDGRVTKGSALYRLIKAGSVFIPRDKEEFLSCAGYENGEAIGYNTYIAK